jgi:hypothetical protein
MEEFPQLFLLIDDEDNIVCDSVNFSSIKNNVKKDYLFFDINMLSKNNIDLVYLKDNDYYLYFKDEEQERAFRVYVKSYIIDKKYDCDSTNNYITCRLSCFLWEFYGYLNMKKYNKLIKQNKKVKKSNRFELLDL